MILWSRETMEGPDRDRVVGEFKLMLDKVLAEDFSMVESLQNSTGAAGFTPGRMSRLERGVQHFVKHGIARLFGAPASARAPAALRASGEGG